MQVIIDPKSHVPIYRQIIDQIRQSIAIGVYRPEEALPSLRKLAQEIRVNPNTIQRAYDELEREGVIESRRGVGVFVVDRRRLTARGSTEKSTSTAFKKTVQASLAAGVTPSRIRELFEASLAAALPSARKQPPN